jgi:hypothetical protein
MNDTDQNDQLRAACLKVRELLCQDFPALQAISNDELKQRAAEARQKGKPWLRAEAIVELNAALEGA